MEYSFSPTTGHFLLPAWAWWRWRGGIFGAAIDSGLPAAMVNVLEMACLKTATALYCHRTTALQGTVKAGS